MATVVGSSLVYGLDFVFRTMLLDQGWGVEGILAGGLAGGEGNLADAGQRGRRAGYFPIVFHETQQMVQERTWDVEYQRPGGPRNGRPDIHSWDFVQVLF